MPTRGKPVVSRETSAAEEESKAVVSEKASLGPELEALWQVNGETMNTIMRTNEAVMRGMIALSQEVFEFGNTRIRENLERAQSLSKCHDLEEALNVQSGFVQSATQEYLTESANLMKLMSEISQDCWAPTEDRTKQALQELSSS